MPKASGQGLAYRIRDVKTVLVSAPGVLLEEWSPEQLQVQTYPCLLSSAMMMADP